MRFDLGALWQANAIAAFADRAALANGSTSPPEGEVADRPPGITALQILERIAFVIASKEEAENTERTRERLAVLAELAHLAGVALGRAPIVPPKAAP